VGAGRLTVQNARYTAPRAQRTSAPSAALAAGVAAVDSCTTA